MKNVALSRWRILVALLFALTPPLARAVDLRADDPGMGEALVAMSFTAADPARLDQHLKEAAKAYRAGDFATAARFYESALALEPSPAEPLRTSLGHARTMLTAQRKAQSEIPQEPKARAAFLEVALRDAEQFYNDKQFDKAYEKYQRLWLTAGDFEGKTLRMLARARAELPATPAAVQVAAVQPAVAADGDVATALAVMAMTTEPLPAPQQTPAPSPVVQIPAPVQQGVSTGTSQPLPVVDDVTRLEVTRLLHEAEQQLNAGRLDEARRLVNEALTRWPDSPQARQMLAALNARQPGATPREQVDALLVQGDQLLRDRKPAEALERFKAALALDPQSQAAVNRIERAQAAVEQNRRLTMTADEMTRRRELDLIHAQAVKYYNEGEIIKARDLWQQILSADPNDKLAQTWLENTQAALERLQADDAARAAAAARAQQREQLLNHPIRITTDGRIGLSEFMTLLSFLTPVELEYVLAPGADAQIQANFVDKRLGTVLDAVLLPAGLAWEIDDNNLITIKPNLVTRTYQLTPAQATNLRTLLDSGELHRLIWMQSDPPSSGASITLDERLNLLMITGSDIHIQRIEDYLRTSRETPPPGLIIRTYKIRPEDGERIKSLIRSIIAATSTPDSPFIGEAKVVVDESDLIIRDTLENLTKIEELLLNEGFIEGIRENRLDIANFSLVPKDIEDIASEQVRVFTSRVVEAIKVFLYAREGERASNEQGRKLWFDEATLSLTIVDTPDNLARVGDYIASLPEISERQLQRVIFLRFAIAQNLAASILDILNLAGGSSLTAGGGQNEQLLNMRRGEETTFQGARFRLIRVEANNEQDIEDDSAQINVITNIGVNQVTVRQLDTQFIEDFEITAEYVRATGQIGDGTARIRVRYAPRNLQVQQPVGPDPALLLAEQAAIESQGLSVTPFGEQNALIVRYTNPGLFADVVDLIAQLDQPARQVAIETKFVIVNETRAKEVSADINVAGLGSGREIDWGTQSINTSFAQDIAEFRDVFSPPIESPLNANLIKGTTLLNAVIGNFPNISYQLRLLEAEGIVNVVNGPRVTAVDGVEAEFRIENYSTQGGGDPPGANDTVEVFNPFDAAAQNIQLLNQDTNAGGGANLQSAVILRVIPEVTSSESILLTGLEAELLDQERILGSVLTAVVTAPPANPNQTISPIVSPAAIVNAYTTLPARKLIRTDARVSNGGTIVIGGWTGERSEEYTSGVPVLRNMPYLGKLFFSRNQRSRDRTTLLIFLTATIIE